MRKISLLDSDDRKNKKNTDVCHSSFGEKRVSSYSLEGPSENYVTEDIDNGFRGNFSKIKMKLDSIAHENF